MNRIKIIFEEKNIIAPLFIDLLEINKVKSIKKNDLPKASCIPIKQTFKICKV